MQGPAIRKYCSAYILIPKFLASVFLVYTNLSHREFLRPDSESLQRKHHPVLYFLPNTVSPVNDELLIVGGELYSRVQLSDDYMSSMSFSSEKGVEYDFRW